MMRRFRQFPTIGGRRGGIPADCVLVQYLRSTGTQYIDTGIVVTPTTGAYWKIKCNTFNDGCLGMYQSSIDMLYIDFYGNGIYFRYGNYASSKITSGFDASGVNEMSCKDGSCYLNGTSVYDGANTSSIGTNARTLYIFARNNRGSAAGYASVDLYAHKIYDGSDLVADFVPVRRVESGVSVGYMCDRLTGELYGNQGTGAFVIGPDAGAVSARDYVQDGLVAMWDGIENAGWGTHDASATVWKDLIGTRDATINGGTWGENCWNCGNNNATFTGSFLGGDFTIEFIFTGDASEAQNYATPLTNAGDSYSFFRRNGLYWEVKLAGGEGLGRAVLNPFYEKPYWVRHTSTSPDESGYHDMSSSNVGNYIYTARAVDSTWQIGGNSSRFLGASAKYYALRVYNRALTATEIAANYAVDRERYNLP